MKSNHFLATLLLLAFFCCGLIAFVDAGQRQNFMELTKYLLFGLFGWMLPSPVSR
jgi:hypothetical protein